MAQRNNRNDRDSGVQVSAEDTYVTVTLEGHEQITELIWDAIMAVATPRLKIGRNTSLTESRNSGDDGRKLIGVRYLSLVYHISELPPTSK
jgi:hypothetical protein